MLIIMVIRVITYILLYLIPKTCIYIGNDPESIYAVMSGTNYNDQGCFDYGNSETDDKDDGCGAMEAIYFGNAHWHGYIHIHIYIHIHR